MKQTFAKALRAVMITLLTIHMVSCEQFYIFDTEGSPSTTDNHPQAVDLGLSVNWASCNLGATSPEECGDYYAWGETEKKTQYTQETYIYANNIDGNGDVDKYTDIGADICGTMHDVASAKLGEAWRMPTLEEIEELCEKCTWEWGTINGINGQIVTGLNGKSIFLPAAGEMFDSKNYATGRYGTYWSGTTSGNYNAFRLFIEKGTSVCTDNRKFIGFSVRPVKEK